MPEQTATEPALEGAAQDAAPVAPAATEQAEVPEVSAPSTFTVKVNGVEEQVTMEEALAGYQRQSAFTKGMQDLSQQREQLSQAEQLWNAIEANPEHTISAIADAYGFKLTPQQAAAAEAQRESAEPNPFEDEQAPDNADPRWGKVEQFMAQAQQERLQAQIDRELTSVHAKYGVQFDDSQLIQFAVDRGIANLDDAFKAWSFDAASNVARDRKIQQGKATAPPIAGGHGVAAGATVAGSGNPFPTIEEAYETALAAEQG